MNIKSRLGVATFALALVASVGLVQPAYAADSSAPSPESVHQEQAGGQVFVGPSSETASTQGNGVSTQRASYVVTCNVTADSPHNSRGAGGHIYKSRVSCSGSGSGVPPQVTIRVKGALRYDAANYAGDTSGGISWSTVRSSEETRIVNTNNTTYTFYTPRTGTSGATAKGHYQGSTTVEILSPVGQKVGSAISSVEFRP